MSCEVNKYKPKIEVTCNSVFLGDSPHWDAERQVLYYVDVIGQTINRYVPRTNQHTQATIEKGPISMIVPMEGTENKFIISINRSLAIITWDGVSETIFDIEQLLSVEKGQVCCDNRFNAGKADPSGRLWAGTMGPQKNGVIEIERGALYSLIGKHDIKTHLKNVTCASGMAWNEKLKKMYFIDSITRSVVEYEFDITKGGISKCREIFSLNDHKIMGLLNGMTIDIDGNLWMTVFGGSCVIQVNPSTSELLQRIEFPTPQLTSLTFGGQNMNELFVTSAQLREHNEKSGASAGAIFKVTGINTKGLPGVKIRIRDS